MGNRWLGRQLGLEALCDKLWPRPHTGSNDGEPDAGTDDSGAHDSGADDSSTHDPGTNTRATVPGPDSHDGGAYA